MNFWMTRRCSISNWPAPHALAVAGSSGGIGCPVSVVRGCSCAASRSRRRDSAGLMRRTSAMTLYRIGPISPSSLRSSEPAISFEQVVW